jgi:hypothetical protein
MLRETQKELLMIHLLTSIILIFCLAVSAFAQSVKQAAQTQKALADAADRGQPVPTDMTVKNNVNAQAVLIPQIDARRIFGKEIADNYAVIEVNVGNKSANSALIIHGVFIDYSGWALSGSRNSQPSNSINGIQQNPFASFQTRTNTNHVASEEYRIVRGQLEDAQLWTKRAWTMRLLNLAGSLASAYSFSLSEQGILKGINQFSGVFVPGFREAWPDNTPQQLKAISDYGFRTNKVIPKESAEIIVCFFPIDRFLTPGFKKLYLKSPALFFAPFNMLIDKTIRKDVEEVLGKNFGTDLTLQQLKESLPCYLHVKQLVRDPHPQGGLGLQSALDSSADELCMAQFGLTKDANGQLKATASNSAEFKKFFVLDYISQTSLNSVSVTIDGAMTLDTSSMVAKVESIKFDAADNCADDQQPCFWSDMTSDGGTRTGSISGAYLTGGTVEIVEAKQLGLTDLTTVYEGSSDETLNFSFKLSKAVPTGSKLHFKIIKPVLGAAALNGKTTSSRTLEYAVGGPVVSDTGFEPASVPVSAAGTAGAEKVTLTLEGKGFTAAPLSPGVKLHPPSGNDVNISDTVDAAASSASKLVFRIPVNRLTTAGCWKIVATFGDKQPVNMPDKKGTILVLPTLVESVTLKGNVITVTGTGLDATDCGEIPITFTLVNNGQSKPLQKDASSTKETVKFAQPVDTDKTWKLKAVLGGKELTKNPLTLTVPATP